MTETVALPLDSAQRLLDRLGPELRCAGSQDLQQVAVDLVDAIEFRPQLRLAADLLARHQAVTGGLAPNGRATVDQLQALLTAGLVPAGVDPTDPRVAAEIVVVILALEALVARWADAGLIIDPPLQIQGLLRTVAIAVADMARPVTR